MQLDDLRAWIAVCRGQNSDPRVTGPAQKQWAKLREAAETELARRHNQT